MTTKRLTTTHRRMAIVREGLADLGVRTRTTPRGLTAVVRGIPETSIKRIAHAVLARCTFSRDAIGNAQDVLIRF